MGTGTVPGCSRWSNQANEGRRSTRSKRAGPPIRAPAAGWRDAVRVARAIPVERVHVGRTRRAGRSAGMAGRRSRASRARGRCDCSRQAAPRFRRTPELEPLVSRLDPVEHGLDRRRAFPVCVGRGRSRQGASERRERVRTAGSTAPARYERRPARARSPITRPQEPRARATARKCTLPPRTPASRAALRARAVDPGARASLALRQRLSQAARASPRGGRPRSRVAGRGGRDHLARPPRRRRP